MTTPLLNTYRELGLQLQRPLRQFKPATRLIHRVLSLGDQDQIMSLHGERPNVPLPRVHLAKTKCLERKGRRWLIQDNKAFGETAPKTHLLLHIRTLLLPLVSAVMLIIQEMHLNPPILNRILPLPAVESDMVLLYQPLGPSPAAVLLLESCEEGHQAIAQFKMVLSQHSLLIQHQSMDRRKAM